MKSWEKFLIGLCTTIGTVVILVAIYFVSWAVTVGLVWLIFKMFSLDFSLNVATGIWLIWLVVKKLFNTAQSKK